MSKKQFLISAVIVTVLAGGYYFYRTYYRAYGGRTARILAWIRNPDLNSDWVIPAGTRCGQAPFIFPTTGVPGFIWDDSFRIGHRHQGIDIFAGTEVDTTEVIAAYPGYLTRLPDWKSSVIVRVPSDPLQPGRQIWLYYTHMADKNGNSFISDQFPPGTSEVPIEAGTLLGHQGNYSGDPNNPTGVHLHFSIVQDDGSGHFRNELEIKNTLDPSPYLGMQLNSHQNQGEIPSCQ
jgi:murein DD-endopeptidase MepM/ murein hydrolase activator NlpD